MLLKKYIFFSEMEHKVVISLVFQVSLFIIVTNARLVFPRGSDVGYIVSGTVGLNLLLVVCYVILNK